MFDGIKCIGILFNKVLVYYYNGFIIIFVYYCKGFIIIVYYYIWFIIVIG